MHTEPTCKQCGAEMTPGHARLSVFCLACLTKAMDELTEKDIAVAVEALADYDKNGGTSLEDLRKELDL